MPLARKRPTLPRPHTIIETPTGVLRFYLGDCLDVLQGRTPLDRRAIGVEYQDASNISRWRTGGDNRRCRGNTWFVPYVTIQSGGEGEKGGRRQETGGWNTE